MSYNYQAEKAFVFTEKGMLMFLEIRDNAVKLLKSAGAARAQELINAVKSGDTFLMMACVDRLEGNGRTDRGYDERRECLAASSICCWRTAMTDRGIYLESKCSSCGSSLGLGEPHKRGCFASYDAARTSCRIVHLDAEEMVGNSIIDQRMDYSRVKPSLKDGCPRLTYYDASSVCRTEPCGKKVARVEQEGYALLVCSEGHYEAKERA